MQLTGKKLAALRHYLHRQLDPLARGRPGLSPINKALVLLVILAAAAAILETEPTISGGREPLFRALELSFGSVFLVEYFCRIWVAVESPRFKGHRFPRLRYAFTPAAMIDFVAVVPTLIAPAISGTLLLRSFRILRILRLAKLGRISSAWQDLAGAVRSRSSELLLTLILALVAMLVSSTFLFWAEADAQPDKFGSIPRALWWSVVTLTTVGYGDVYPVTAMGKFFAALLAIGGIGLIALPTGILAAAFSDAMQQRRKSERK